MSHRFPRLRYFQHNPSGPAVVRAVVDHVVITGTALGFVGDTAQLTATAYDAKGVVIPGVSVDWSSSQPSMISVIAGLCTFLVPGTATITATVDGRAYPVGVSVLPSTPAQLFAALSAVSIPMDVYADATSPVSSVAAVGAASITTVVDGGQPSGKRITKWDSAINPGGGKHWRPSADFGSGNGANSDGLTIRGGGMELPGSVGYAGTGCHPEDTSITPTTPGQTGDTQLKDYLQEKTAGLTWVFVGRFKNNTNIVQIGETSADPDYAFFAGDALAQMQAVADDPNMLGLSSDTATGSARSRVVVAYTQLPTTTKGYFDIKRINRDIYQPFGGTGIADTGPALTGTRRTRLLGNGGFNTAPQCEVNLAIPFKGQYNAAAWKLICDTAKAWWPDLYEDTRPSLVLLSGDSFPAGYYGPGQESNIHDLVLGKNNAPSITNTAAISFPLSGNTPWTFQFPFIRLLLDGDTSFRTRLGLHEEETLNGAEQPENYFIHKWFHTTFGSKAKSVIHNENYNSNTNLVVGTAIAADVAANWPLYADALFDFLATVPWSSHNFGDGTASWPGGQNPLLWVTAHPSAATQEYKQAMYREALRFLAGGDPSTNTAYGVPTPDNVSLTLGSPTANPTIQAVNWQKASLAGKTWTHAMILGDNSASTAATVDADGTIHGVANGHCLRRSISNDGAQCLVDVTLTGFPILSHTFTAADSTTTVPSADTGQATVVQNDGIWGISSNQLYRATQGIGAGHDTVAWDAGQATGTFTCTLATVAQQMGLVWRNADVSNGFMCLLDTGGNTLGVYKRVAGVDSQIDHGILHTWVNGDVVGVILPNDGSNHHQITINGTVVDTITDAFNNTATKFGATQIGGTTGGRWDNMKLV